jgi:hypothetical protein
MTPFAPSSAGSTLQAVKPNASDAAAAAANAATDQQRYTFKPKLDMRPITTPINLLVCGASSTGKSSFIRICSQMLGAAATPTTSDSKVAPLEATPAAAAEAAGIGPAADPHAVLLSGAGAFSTVLPPIVCPEACRELVYSFQVGTPAKCREPSNPPLTAAVLS